MISGNLPFGCVCMKSKAVFSMSFCLEMSQSEVSPADPSPSRGSSFKSRYCSLLSCSPERFEKELMRRCLFKRARLLYPWIERFNNDFFLYERKLLERIAREDNFSDIRHDIDFYQHKFVTTSTRRGAFRIRISSQRLVRIVREVMGIG